MPITLIGHRGIAGHYPENTLISIQAAIELGLEWVEFDVQPTKDGHLVVCHDHTIDRCSNGFGRVDSYTLEQLQQFDFGGWFAPRFNLEPLLTLDQLLTYALPLAIKLNIEVKLNTQQFNTVANQLKHLLEKHRFPAERIVISSFSHEMLRAIHQCESDYPIAVLSDKLTDADKQLLKDVDAVGCNLDICHLNEDEIKQLQKCGYKVWSYTVNQPEQIKHLPSLDGIFSDFPQRFLTAD
ncbi:glycerophosphodiester phosphodiesterase family protein [Vibrio sp. LaRot3]|uniref:glycerophosphodiester phosphodiesterase family protein n=1 Tax=Vibrio sp. LaRot3 TaxID=2998829 RepID=UPI0022CDD1FD|nr:glycerophosphodiester phosphodiesterase family protein [Vibrio sp. LaRot3]MDA0147473.1 glycerophosphodiester phosphodiesterase family protein [Vibrio sp. LaRot3]